MSGAPEIDSPRRRSVRSVRFLAAIALASAVLALLGPASLLWTVHHPAALLAAFPLGHLAFGLSVLLTRLSPRTAWYAMKGSVEQLYRPYGGETVLFYLLLATAEEVLLRAVPLSHGSGAWWQILALGLLFAVIHVGKMGKGLVVFVDFFVFGVLMCLLFLWWRDLWPLVIIHTVRNASVAKVFTRKKTS